MATWISHMMIADNILNKGLYLDKMDSMLVILSKQEINWKGEKTND